MMRSPQAVEELEVVQEKDVVAARPVKVVGVAAVLTALAAAGGVAAFLSGERARHGYHEAPTPTHAPPQIDGIHQTLLARDRHGWELREAQRKELDAYRVIDRERGIVQIPIGRAMQIVVDDPKRRT